MKIYLHCKSLFGYVEHVSIGDLQLCHDAHDDYAIHPLTTFNPFDLVRSTHSV
jgi:hypothetical protein